MAATNILQTVIAAISLIVEQLNKESARTGKSSGELLSDAAKQIGLNEQEIKRLQLILQPTK